MTDALTTNAGPSWLRGARGQAAEEHLALVIAWSADEPERIGEVALVGEGEEGLVLGRGEGQPGRRRVEWLRQRPDRTEDRPPLAGRAVSREHLLLTAADDGIAVERMGRGDLSVSGTLATRAVARPGDTITLRNALVLYVTRRPGRLTPLRQFPADLVPCFGAADVHGMVGESPAAWALRDQVAFAAGAGAHALVVGESGTGKELVADAIHALSPRASHPLVARSAATLPESLIDAELFGNLKDYPNPGMRERHGLIGEADGSTLFLDEIGELSSELQAHLLRVLDGGEYHRLGEAVSRRADVRLIAATNCDPGELKHDLAARLALRIQVPGLGERRDDVPLLVRHLLRRMISDSPALARFLDGDEPRVHPEVIEHLVRRPYTHHVRELEAWLWRAAQASSGNYLAPLPDMDDEAGPRASREVEPSREEILAALERQGGNVSLAWRELGMSSRYALYRLMRKHGIRRDV